MLFEFKPKVHNGKELLLIGGFPDNENVWNNQIDFLNANGYTCYIFVPDDFESDLEIIQSQLQNSVNNKNIYTLIAHDIGVIWSSVLTEIPVRVYVDVYDLDVTNPIINEYFNLFSMIYETGKINPQELYKMEKKMNTGVLKYSTRKPTPNMFAPYSKYLKTFPYDQIPKPDYFIVGTKSNVTYYSKNTEETINIIKMISGHYPMRELPNEFNISLLSFL